MVGYHYNDKIIKKEETGINGMHRKISRMHSSPPKSKMWMVYPAWFYGIRKEKVMREEIEIFAGASLDDESCCTSMFVDNNHESGEMEILNI